MLWPVWLVHPVFHSSPHTSTNFQHFHSFLCDIQALQSSTAPLSCGNSITVAVLIPTFPQPSGTAAVYIGCWVVWSTNGRIIHCADRHERVVWASCHLRGVVEALSGTGETLGLHHAGNDPWLLAEGKMIDPFCGLGGLLYCFVSLSS